MNYMETLFGSRIKQTKNYRVTDQIDDLIDPLVSTRKPDLKKDDSILFVRLSAIGDVVRLLPVVKYLRINGFEGEIAWAVHPPCDSLLEDWPEIDVIHTITRDNWLWNPFRLKRELNSIADRQYDWCFDFHSLLKSSLVVSQSSGTKVGFSYSNSRELNYFFQSININPLPSKLPRILKYLSLVRPFTKTYDLNRDDLVMETPGFNSITNSVREAASQSPILIHPRTSHDRYGQQKEWGEVNFIEFLKQSIQYLDSSNKIYVTWGPGEEESAQEISTNFGDQVQLAPETPDLKNLVYLVGNADLIVSGDTAPCHISDILGTPLLALFGGSDYFVSGPFFTNYRLVTTRRNESSTKDIPIQRVLKTFFDLFGEIC